MDLITKLSDRVVALETDLKQTKKVSGAAYTKLIKKVKRLVKKDKLSKSRRKLRLVLSGEEDSDSDILAQEDPSKQGRKIAQIEKDEGITLVQMGAQTQGNTDFTIANVSITTAGAEISTASSEVKTVGDYVDVIAAESLVYIKRSAAKTKDKGKGIMEESESAMTKTKRQQEQERLGLETAVRLQEEFDEEERKRIARFRLQTEEREKYSKDDQAKMLVDLINQRKRYFAAQEAKAKRNKPMTQAQQRTYMRTNTFVPLKTEIRRGIPELLADSSQAAVTESTEAGGTKRATEEELGQQSSKKQNPDELSQEELQQLMIIVPEEGMNIEALQTKYPIIDWKVYTKDSRKYWKIIRVGSHTEVYQVFEDMLKTFDKDDLVKLWSLVQERFNSTEPTEDKEREIWVELKRLLYDTCGVHHVSTKNGVDIYMLVEREYPLSRGVLTQMLVAKLLVDQDNEMSRELRRKIFMLAERPRSGVFRRILS
ncbi:hypothetical protein Tco_0269764 [Tanacetum coccineum]